jgi:MFS family permease
MRDLLRRRPFGRLLLSYLINYTGDFIGLVALAILVYGETHNALAVSALFIASQFLPALAAPALTARIDQLSLRGSLPAIYFAEAAVYSVLAFISDRFLLVPVLALALVDGVLMLTARGLTRAAVSATLEPHGLLRQGNGLLNVAFAFATAGGAALGGVIVTGVSVGGALLFDAASFVAVGILLASTSKLPAITEASEPFLRHLRGGLQRVREDPATRLLILGEGAAILFFALIVPIEVFYAKETLGTDDAGFGILLSSWGVGIVLGSLAFLRLRSRRIRTLILCSTAAIGVAYLGMAGVTTLTLACAFSVLGGLGNGIQWIAIMTALQESTPLALQARITGLLESAASIMTGVGFLLGGLVVSVASPPTAYAVSGVGVCVLVLAASAWPAARAFSVAHPEEPPVSALVGAPPRLPHEPSRAEPVLETSEATPD